MYTTYNILSYSILGGFKQWVSWNGVLNPIAVYKILSKYQKQCINNTKFGLEITLNIKQHENTKNIKWMWSKSNC